MKDSIRFRLLIIGLHWPEPHSSAAGSRMMQLMACFQAQQWDIIFASPSQNSPFAEDLKQQNIQTASIQPNTETADLFFKQIAPDIVLFDRFMMEEQFGWRLSETCPEAVKILDTEDLHFLRRARQAAVKKGKPAAEANLYSETAKREIASILRCDLTLLISKVERQLLIDKFHIDERLLWYLPFMTAFKPADEITQIPTFEQRQNFVFVGNFRHPPNADAVGYLKKEVWPLVRKQLPKAQLLIYGAYPLQKITQLANKKEGFDVRGRATDLPKVMRQARVLLAPLRYGAGLKGKFFDAMQFGVPAVTTPIGAEGIAERKSFNGLIADSAEAIAQAAIALYTDNVIWNNAQFQGVKLWNETFVTANYQADFIARLNTLKATLETHRQHNFIGQILQHHQHQSTKYMSRWIELKNRFQDFTADH